MLANDFDPDGGALTLVGVSTPVNGVVTSNGSFINSYVPNAGFSGVETLTYTIRDNHGLTSTGLLTVLVDTAGDQPPVAQSARYSVQAGHTLPITLSAVDPNGQLLTWRLVTEPIGPLTGSLDGAAPQLTYTAPTNLPTDTFVYEVSDGTLTAQATITITILRSNVAPVANDDAASTPKATPVSIDVLANDTDADVVDILEVYGWTAGSHGSVVCSLEECTYTPEVGYTGTDKFTYSVRDGFGGLAEATVTITIVVANHRPYAVDDIAQHHGDAPITIDVLRNDTDIDPDDVLQVVDNDGLGGRATCGGSSCTYTPPPGFTGQESFPYTVSDGNGGLSKATVVVRVRGNHAPIAADDELLVLGTRPGAVEVLDNDLDPDGDRLTLTLVDPPTSGTASCSGTGPFARCSYTSAAGESGTDAFTYQIDDGRGGTDTARVDVVIEGHVNGDPKAVDDDAISHGFKEFRISPLSNDVDPEDDPLTLTLVTPTTVGTLDCTGGGCTYTPPTDQPFPIETSFTYTASDSYGGVSLPATVGILVTENQGPTARNDLLTAPGWDEPATNPPWGRIQPITFNDFDPDGDRLAISTWSQPAGGNGASNCYFDITEVWYCEYLPHAGNLEPDSFTYTIDDLNGGSSTATITVNVTPNRAPQALPDVVLAHGSASHSMDLLTNDSDPDGDLLSVISNTALPPEQGSVECRDGGCTYTPPAGYDGPYPLRTVPFEYTVDDSRGGRSTSQASINLIENQPPIALNDRLSSRFGAPGEVVVLANDVDPDGDTLTATVGEQPSHGVAECYPTLGAYECRHTPVPGYLGPDSFTYTISDGHGGTSKPATVNVTVVRNSAPIAGDDEISTKEGRLTTIELPNDNDSDPDGDAISLLEYSQPQHGVVTCGTDQGCVYYPVPGEFGPDEFTYTVTDGLGGFSNPATVTVRVDASLSRSPVANDDSLTVVEHRTSSLDVLANDTDADGDKLKIRNWDYPAEPSDTTHGTLDCTKLFQTRCTYTLDQSYPGPFPLTETFTYQITDRQPGTTPSTATVTVTVVENRAPTAEDDTAATRGVDPVAISVLDNDGDPDEDPIEVVDLERNAEMLGTVTCGDAVCHYEPPAELAASAYPFEDGFTYTIADPRGRTDSAEVSVTVNAPVGAPNAIDDFAQVTTGETTTIAVRSNDLGSRADIVEFSAPTNGVSSCPALNGAPGTCSYVPNPSFTGTDTFTYTIEGDYGPPDTAVVTIEVVDEPAAYAAVDDTREVPRRVPTAIDVLANDENPAARPMRIVDFDPKFPQLTSAHGAGVSCNASTCWYLPPKNAAGPFPLTDTFTYQATDGRGDPVQATVTVTVIDNRPPNTTADSATVRGPDMINVLENDRDPDGDPFGDIEWDTTGTRGTVVGCSVATGYCEYVPNGPGSDSFTYRVSDNPLPDDPESDEPDGLWSEWTTVNILVIGNKAPIAVADTERVDGTDPVFINVRSNDRDPDGDPLNVVVESGTATHGTFECVSDGCTYQAPAAFTGTDEFAYTIDDGQGGTATATVTLTSGDQPAVPVVTGLDPLVGATAGGTSVTVSGSGFTGATAVAFGSAPGSEVVVVSDSEITVTSPPGFAGSVFVRVTAPSGTSAESPGAVFTYEAVAPDLAPIGDRSVAEGVGLSFTAVATDADVPANALRFSLEGAPVGASIDAVTGVFSWTPTEADGPGVFSFDVVVVDDGVPVLEDREAITVTVTELNRAPVADAGGDADVLVGQAVTLDGSGSVDLDVPVQTLSYSWSLSSVPAGSALTGLNDAATVAPSFTPDVAGDFVIELVVNDGLVDSPADTVTITAVANTPPVLEPVGDHSVAEGVGLSFTAVATDADLPANVLRFSLEDAPVGAAIDPVSGVFSWTPTEADGPGVFSFDVVVTDDGTPVETDRETITVTVTEVNTAPVLEPVGDHGVAEGVGLSFTAVATDADVPSNVLRFSLEDAPVGAAIDPVSGVFSWTPTEADGPGALSFDVVVTDDGSPVETDRETITVTVTEVNTLPVLEPVGDHSVAEGAGLSFTATAADADVPASVLRFSLEDAPVGASLDPVSGVFSWTPTEADGPGEFSFDVVVTDDGVPVLEDRETITVTVTEVNLAPVADAGGDADAIVGQAVTLDGSGSVDLDVPVQTLSYSWSLSSVPAGSALTGLNDAATVAPSFTPDVAGDFVIELVVNDGLVDSPAATVTITVTAGVGSVVLTPTTAVVGTNTPQAFAVEGFDSFGNSLGDRTAEAVFTISPNGSCTLNACRSGTTGLKVVTARVGTLTATATLDVRVRQTISFPAIGAKTMLQSPVIVSATATSGLLVTFTTTTPDVCTAAGLRGSSITLVGPGTCTVRADQAGDGTRAPAVSVLRNFTVSKVVQTITFPSLTGKLITASPVLVSATASSRLPVSFTTTTPTVCTADGGTISLLDAGTCTVRAEQPGDSVYRPANLVNRSFTVSKLANTITFASHRQQDAGGEPGDGDGHVGERSAGVVHDHDPDGVHCRRWFGHVGRGRYVHGARRSAR